MSTDTTLTEVDGPYAGKTFAEILDDYVLVRGDLVEEYARQQLVRIVATLVQQAKADGWDEGAKAARWSTLTLPALRRCNPYRPCAHGNAPAALCGTCDTSIARADVDGGK